MIVNEKLISLEKEAIEMLAAQDEENKDILLSQLAVATITERYYSGSGFFTYYSIPDNTFKNDKFKFTN